MKCHPRERPPSSMTTCLEPLIFFITCQQTPHQKPPFCAKYCMCHAFGVVFHRGFHCNEVVSSSYSLMVKATLISCSRHQTAPLCLVMLFKKKRIGTIMTRCGIFDVLNPIVKPQSSICICLGFAVTWWCSMFVHQSRK